ncbi:MAG: hypothetical protein KC912_23825 [Proteobacteria bacterium]|nr:hypothetical protein [Pseudomonadota bacterium]
MAGDTNGFEDVIVYDVSDGTRSSISINGGGATNARISGDGRYVGFVSNSTTARGGGPPTQVYLHDRNTATTELISKTAAGVAGLGESFIDDVADDGGHVSYRSGSDDLVADDTNAKRDVFVWDAADETNTLGTLTYQGSQTPYTPSESALSADGNLVVFSSSRTYTSDANDTLTHVYMRDVSAETTVVLDVEPGGLRANGNSGAPDIAGNGKHAALRSAATDLAADDTNGLTDVFVVPTGM